MFVRAASPIWFFDNLIGQPVDDTYYAFFLTNTLPYIPQAVFQDPSGTSPWNSPLEFQPSSGLPNNLYFDPNEVYRIEIRQGNTQTSPLIWLIEDFVPPFVVGQYYSSSVLFGSAVSLVSPNVSNVISLTLPPGDYDISGTVLFHAGASTVPLYLIAGISQVSATFEIPGTNNNFAGNGGPSSTLPTGYQAGLPVGPYRANLLATTTVYLLALSSFSVSTMVAWGYMNARRIA